MDETAGKNLLPYGCKCNILINCEKRRRKCGCSREKRDNELLLLEEKIHVFIFVK